MDGRSVFRPSLQFYLFFFKFQSVLIYKVECLYVCLLPIVSASRLSYGLSPSSDGQKLTSKKVNF